MVANVWAAGLLIVPVIPICMNMANELTFPLDATSVQGVLMSCAVILGLIISLAATFIAAIGPSYCTMLFGGCCLVGAIFAFFV